jgi:DNA-binding transcriptional MerR regulator
MTDMATAEIPNATVPAIAREARVSEDLVRDYANKGLIECTRLASGVRLFKPSVAQRVREIYAERMAIRGHRRSA